MAGAVDGIVCRVISCSVWNRRSDAGSHFGLSADDSKKLSEGQNHIGTRRFM
jgi:hypothetical protein